MPEALLHYFIIYVISIRIFYWSIQMATAFVVHQTPARVAGHLSARRGLPRSRPP